MNEPTAPEGMVFVGYYCEHDMIHTEGGNPTWKYTPHRTPFHKQRPKYKAERGWEESTSTSKALHFPPYREIDEERNCQYRVPIFVHAADLEAAKAKAAERD
jgi:hypothetical protein